MDIRQVGAEALRDVLAAIDRTEDVEVEFELADGALRERPVRYPTIPAWDAAAIDAHVAFLAPRVDAGAPALVAFDGGRPVGLTVVDPVYDPPLAWLVFLHVTRTHRRAGVGRALWDAAAAIAVDAGATSLYVSAIPTGAVAFYRSRGCVVAEPPRPELFELEPEDIHLVCPLPTR